MSLKNLVRSLLIVGVGLYALPLAAADSTPAAGKAPRSSIPSTAPETAKVVPQLADPDQDDLISEILGLSTRATQRAEAKIVTDKRSFFTCAAAKKQPNASESSTNRRQPTSGAFFGRIIGVNLDTSTVDLEFEGRRPTTVGSKFSVFHDYALSTEFLGNLEIVYLAGGNRAIAKPGARTDITRMGKGDRVSGRVVAKSATAGGTSPSDGSSSANGSCVKPTNDELPPVPPPDPAPYLPEESSAVAPPSPLASGITRADAPKGMLSSYRSATSGTRRAAAPTKSDIAPSVARSPACAVPAPAAPKTSAIAKKEKPIAPLPLPITTDITTRPAVPPKWLGLSARSWAALLKSSGRSPETASLEAQAVRTPVDAKLSAKSLWCAEKPKPTGVTKAAPTATPLAVAKVPPPSILLFED